MGNLLEESLKKDERVVFSIMFESVIYLHTIKIAQKDRFSKNDLLFRWV